MTTNSRGRNSYANTPLNHTYASERDAIIAPILAAVVRVTKSVSNSKRSLTFGSYGSQNCIPDSLVQSGSSPTLTPTEGDKGGALAIREYWRGVRKT